MGQLDDNHFIALRRVCAAASPQWWTGTITVKARHHDLKDVMIITPWRTWYYMCNK